MAGQRCPRVRRQHTDQCPILSPPIHCSEPTDVLFLGAQKSWESWVLQLLKTEMVSIEAHLMLRHPTVQRIIQIPQENKVSQAAHMGRPSTIPTTITAGTETLMALHQQEPRKLVASQ